MIGVRIPCQVFPIRTDGLRFRLVTWVRPLVGEWGEHLFVGPDIQVSILTHERYGNELKYHGLTAQTVPLLGLASHLKGQGSSQPWRTFLIQKQLKVLQGDSRWACFSFYRGSITHNKKSIEEYMERVKTALK